MTSPADGVSRSGGGAPLLALLRLASPGLPIGAFAYSQTLEAAVEAELVRDESSLVTWTEGILRHGLARLDLPAVFNAHELCGRDAPHTELVALAARVLAMRGAAELEAEDRRLGQALARVLEGWGAPNATAWVTAPQASYPVLFALGGWHGGATRFETALAFGFAWAEAQVAAALRLLPLGQTAGQRVLSSLVAALPDVVMAARELADVPDAWSPSAASPAHLSARHETQYCRLFRS
jgi:urease accessory protein